jgi:hypothetical protein
VRHLFTIWEEKLKAQKDDTKAEQTKMDGPAQD